MARNYGFSGSSISIFLIVAGCAAAVPVQLQGGMNILQREDYGPAAGEFLSKYLEDRGVADLRNLDGIDGGHFSKQNHRRLDSGSSFGENKKFLPGRRIAALYGQPGNLDEIDRSDFDRFAKRNIDEIDRTAFDSFLKRNLDEIDRVGWSGFVKRFDNYLANGHNL